MSQPDLTTVSPPRGVLVQKPKTSVYTVMLIIALVAVLVGCIFLYLEIRSYGGFGAVKGRISSLDRPFRGGTGYASVPSANLRAPA